MSDNQEEKIKILIRKAGFKVEEAIDLLEISKQTFYNNIRKHPLDRNFIKKVLDKLSINLEENLIVETKKPDQEDQAEIEMLQAEVQRLKDLVLKLQAELLEFYKKQ